MKVNELKSEMARYGDTIKSLAEGLNITYQTLRNKFDGVSEFGRDEIAEIGKRYNLSADRVFEIFFDE